MLFFNQKKADISINFVIGIPPINGLVVIYNILNQVSKNCYLITTKKKINTKKLINFFVYYIYKLHAFPKIIVLDCNI